MHRGSSLSVLAGMLLTQGCALTTPDFGPKHLEDAGTSPDAGSCLGQWLHADPSIADEGIGDLLFVQHAVDLGDMPGDGGSPVLWTPPDSTIPTSCTNPVSNLPMGGTVDDGGNAFGQASYELAKPGALTASAYLSEIAASGASAALIRIVGYNGQADDDRIEVDEAQGTCASTPSWNGTDLWWPSTDFGKKVGADYTPTISALTSVRGWTIDVVLDGPSTPARPHPTRLRATIRRASNRWFLSGEASSQILASDLLQLNQIGGACFDTPNYAMQKLVDCSHADIDSDHDGLCDALSSAWTLQAEDARLGCVHFLPSPFRCQTGVQSDDCNHGPMAGTVPTAGH